MTYRLKLYTNSRYEKKIELVGDGAVIDSVRGDMDVVSSVSELLKKHNLSLEDVEFVDYENAPGSFTGLKVGAVVANVLNWCMGKISPSEAKMPDYGSEPNIQGPN